MEIFYVVAAIVLLPIVGAGLRWLRSRGAMPQTLLQQALGGLTGAGNAADYLLGLLGWLGPGLAIGGLLAGADVLSVALLLELGGVAAAMLNLLQGRTWTQVAGAQRLQFTFFQNLGYFVALVALIAQAGRLDLTTVALWPAGAIKLAVHILALLTIVLALPAKLGAHPFEVAASAEAISKQNPLTSPNALGNLAREGGLLIFVATLLLPSPGGVIAQAAIVALITIILALLVRFFSLSISVRLRPDQAYDFYWLYGLALGAVLIIGTIAVRLKTKG